MHVPIDLSNKRHSRTVDSTFIKLSWGFNYFHSKTAIFNYKNFRQRLISLKWSYISLKKISTYWKARRFVSHLNIWVATNVKTGARLESGNKSLYRYSSSSSDHCSYGTGWTESRFIMCETSLKLYEWFWCALFRNQFSCIRVVVYLPIYLYCYGFYTGRMCVWILGWQIREYQSLLAVGYINSSFMIYGSHCIVFSVDHCNRGTTQACPTGGDTHNCNSSMLPSSATERMYPFVFTEKFCTLSEVTSGHLTRLPYIYIYIYIYTSLFLFIWTDYVVRWHNTWRASIAYLLYVA